MCGILGCLALDSKIDLDTIKVLDKSLLKNHRGPDNHNTYIDNSSQIYLGHQRLSIRDLSVDSNQPIFSKDSRYIMSYNGEIYNTEKLMQKYDFLSKDRSNSDTIILIELISNIGFENTVREIDGMFAIVVWDTKEKNLYLARDKFGEKPLYYGFYKNLFVFSSEFHLFKSEFNFEINGDSIEHFLKLGYFISPYTPFQNCFKLEQSSFLKINQNFIYSNSFDLYKSEIKYDKFAKVKYFDLSNHISNIKKENNHYSIDKIEKVISESVKSQLVSDVGISCFLSGGIDSTIIATMIKKHQSNFSTYTIGFEESEFDESIYAKKIAKNLQSSHNELILNETDALNLIPKLSEIYSEPFADSSQIPTILLSKFVSSNHKVALTGDGGDEVFCGYNRYIYYKSFGKYLMLPKILRSKLNHLIKIIFQNSKSVDKISKINDINSYYFQMVSNFDNSINLNQSQKNLNDVIFHHNRPHDISDIEYMQYLDLKTYLSDDIFHKTDRASMFSSLETRAPFLDLNVVNSAWSLKTNEKVNFKNGKLPLRKILDKYYSNELFDRPKQGFGIPIDTWLRGKLKDWSYDLVFNNNINNYKNININIDLYKDLWQSIMDGKNNGLKLWPYLILSQWMKNYLNK